MYMMYSHQIKCNVLSAQLGALMHGIRGRSLLRNAHDADSDPTTVVRAEES